MKNRLFVIVWALISILLIVYTLIISDQNKRVIGITEVEETTVSFPFPVEVENVTIVPNQQVSKGDLLLELSSEDLEMEADNLKLNISESEQKLKEATMFYKSEIGKINSERRLEINKLRGDISELMISLANENAITKSLNIQLEDSIVNPKSIQLENLELELKLTDQYFNQLLNVKHLEFTIEQTRISQEIETLKKRLSFNQQKINELNVLALYDGYIKKVRVEKNTLLESFTPLVTYSKLSPLYVRAYTDENTRLEVRLGSTVKISSASRKWIETEGVIIAESKRITELPERLKLQPLAQEWGQEFLVQLPADNEFLIGEKVLIR